MKFPPYPEYKRSGVEWLGDVPAHWTVQRLKYVVSINDEALSETTDPNYEFHYVDIGSVDPIAGITKLDEMIFESAPSRARRIVKDGDTIVSTVRTYLKAIAPMKSPRENLIVSTGFAVVRPRKIDPSFLSYALREMTFVETVVARSIGVSYPAINSSEIGTIPIPIPDSTEQTAIAGYLDRATTQIDKLIEKKLTLMMRLTEQRSALISQTVTRGLPPDAARAAGLEPYPEQSQSGIEWLGEVPAHWDVMMLKHSWASSEYGISDSLVGTGPVKVLTMSNIKDGSITLPEEGCLEDVDEAMLLKRDDLLFNRTNSLVHVGKVGLFRDQDDDPVTFASYLVRIRTNHSALPAFMNFLLNTPMLLEFARALALPSINQANLNPTRYGHIKVALPPITEQRAIVAYLDKETGRVEAMLAGIEKAIERLQEYRVALITAAVTGKIDVRGATA
jgi:type I restriction enzyme S subunit